MRRLKLRNLTICLCIICVVAFSIATPIVRVSALAQPIEPELAPVFDTQIYQLTDYVEESMTDPQRSILYLLLGAWAVAQAGTNDYELVDPYTTSDGVTGWLKSTGIQLYNSMLSLQGGNVYDPVTGTNLTAVLSGLVGYALGAAGLAKNYNSESDFLNDVNSQDHYFVPFDPVLQASINAYYGRGGGLWNWQFDEKPFLSTSFNWFVKSLGNYQSTYDYYVSQLGDSLVRGNINSDLANCIAFYPSDYDIIFINSSTSQWFITNENGSYLQNNSSYNFVPYVSASLNAYGEIYQINHTNYYLSSFVKMSDNINLNDFDSYVDAVRYIFNHYGKAMSDAIKHVYIGANWAVKQEIFNIENLNFAQNESPSYDQVPDNTLLDIKGLITGILNNTDLFTVILNNLYDRLGDLITLPDIKVSISLPDDNPLPVNLNEIDSYTHNEYLTLIKEHATNFGETIGEYVAFWHNSDAELTYTILGSFVIIMIGAFIGKWGHS